MAYGSDRSRYTEIKRAVEDKYLSAGEDVDDAMHPPHALRASRRRSRAPGHSAPSVVYAELLPSRLCLLPLPSSLRGWGPSSSSSSSSSSLSSSSSSSAAPPPHAPPPALDLPLPHPRVPTQATRWRFRRTSKRRQHRALWQCRRSVPRRRPDLEAQRLCGAQLGVSHHQQHRRTRRLRAIHPSRHCQG